MTVRWRCRSRTETLPLLTRVSVPSQRSSTYHDRAADGGDAVAAARAEAAVVVAAPQPARRAPGRSGRGAGATAGAGRQRPAQDQLGHAAGAGGLADLEEAAVEGAGLSVVAGQRRAQRDGALARVEDRADRDRGGVGQRHGARGAGQADEHAAGLRGDAEGLAELGRRGRGEDRCRGRALGLAGMPVGGRGRAGTAAGARVAAGRRRRCVRPRVGRTDGEAHVGAERQAVAVAGDEARVVGRALEQPGHHARDGDRVILVDRDGLRGGAVRGGRADLEPVRGPLMAGVDRAVQDDDDAGEAGGGEGLGHRRGLVRGLGRGAGQRAGSGQPAREQCHDRSTSSPHD